MIGSLSQHLTSSRLSAFVDGEMTAEEAHRWRTHLLTCDQCSAAVSAERAVQARMRRAWSCTPAPPSALVSSLRVVGSTDLGVPGAGPHLSPSRDPRLVPAALASGTAGPAGVGGRRLPGARVPTRRLPVGVLAVTTTAAAAAVVGLAVTGAVPASRDAVPPAGPVPGSTTSPFAPAAVVPPQTLPTPLQDSLPAPLEVGSREGTGVSFLPSGFPTAAVWGTATGTRP